MIFKRNFIFALFLLLLFGLLTYKLVFHAQPLYDWDESLYVENGLEMLKNRYYLVPLWQNQPWLDKPPLAPLLFGLVASIPKVPVEISTRLYTLALSIVALVLSYVLYLKASKNRLVATLTAAITSFLPIFVQRMQVVSLDVTLLIGWLGFFAFMDNSLLQTLFLLLSVQSKSLLGFYPLAIYGLFLVYEFLRHEIDGQALLKKIKIMALQALVLFSWYIVAWLVFKEKFIELHIVESHFRRVSASLESHFGARTFYYDLLIQQFGWASVLSHLGIVLSFYLFWRKKISARLFLLQSAFLPWFVFLNLTKTKIAWYLYPVLPQFAFYASYCLFLINKKWIQTVAFTLALMFVFYQGIVKGGLLTTFYSATDPHIRIAKYAKQKCSELIVLVPDYTRETYWTLKKMNLTITTTNWWGEHPSMVFYFGKPLRFSYSKGNFTQNLGRYDCAVLNQSDSEIMTKSELTKIKAFDKMQLYQR